MTPEEEIDALKLATRRTRAEADKLEAEAAKLEAERRKLDVDRQIAHRYAYIGIPTGAAVIAVALIQLAINYLAKH